ncbi:hypothetical protein MM_3361 [Methanosarcina mazei Go1]|uniref:Uncharacterized protein n=1 Tax=Methanosarcina mazei (strain ATCC BAA-159 / DSM 3647 / Goe1 / Go1 / JCM 11833 / OCM 88) TaxID=192952 RepID=Q8PRT2_METMA|nr:hypothetical protein MM_3361 [Methanosarcina mazei Go1]
MDIQQKRQENMFSFNPCFSGSCSRICLKARILTVDSQVSILVLVDLAHEYICIFEGIFHYIRVSILVLVDLAHEWYFRTSKLYNASIVSILVLVDLAHEFILQRQEEEPGEFQSLF